MAKKDYLPIILGSDENAYGTARLFSEFCPEKPLMLCTRQLIPAMHSKLSRVELIADFDKEEVFCPALLKVLRREHAAYEKLVVISLLFPSPMFLIACFISLVGLCPLCRPSMPFYLPSFFHCSR